MTLRVGGNRVWCYRTVVLIAGLFALLNLMRSILIGWPIMASDEYAYAIWGVSVSGADLFSLDPYLQRLTNRLFFAALRGWSWLGGGNDIFVVRLVHVAELLAASALLYSAFDQVVSRKGRWMAALAVLVLPSSFFVLTVLPETDTVFVASLVAYVMIRWFPDFPVRSAAVAGVLSGMALLLKPHAVAWLPALLLTIAVCAYANNRQQALSCFKAAVALLIGWYLGFVATWALTGPGWSFNPTDALGLQFYGNALGGSSQSIYSLMLQSAGYFLAHLLVLAMIFGPALCGLIKACSLLWMKPGEADRRALIAGLFACAMLLSHLVMVAYFSASVGAKSVGEAMRLHGRYLGTVLILLPFFGVWFLETVQVRRARLLATLGLTVTLAFYFGVWSQFKLYPWDNPELFAFFNSGNSYGWDYGAGGHTIGRQLLIACVLAYVVILTFPKYFKWVMSALFALLLLAGNVQMQLWLRVHTSEQSAVTSVAAAMAKLLGPVGPGEGLVIGDDRYGRMSYVLFGLRNAPRVLVKEAGAPITDEEVKGARWVLLTKPYAVEFGYRTAIRSGDLTLYPLAVSEPTVIVKEKSKWSGTPISLRLGTDGTAWSSSRGFNAPEVWGAWSAAPVTDIELPYFVRGRVRVKLFGWVLPENINNPVRITLGDAVVDLRMTGSGADYELDMNVKEAADRIRFEIPPFRPDGSARDLGVALRGVEISATD